MVVIGLVSMTPRMERRERRCSRLGGRFERSVVGRRLERKWMHVRVENVGGDVIGQLAGWWGRAGDDRFLGQLAARNLWTRSILAVVSALSEMDQD